jgi:uncharacterized protein YbaR (Trm112 family)
MTKFKFETEVEADPREVREMLTRGYDAHKVALDAENHRHLKVTSGIPYMLDEERTKTEDERHKEALKNLQREGDLWKQVLLTFTGVE